MAAPTTLLLDVAFYFLATLYYRERMVGPAAERVGETVMAKLPQFALFSLVLCAGCAAAVLWSRRVAFGGTLVAAGVAVVGAVESYLAGLPSVLAVALLGIAVILFALGWSAARNRDRAAWAFLATLSWVLVIFTFFGAPLVRTRAGIDLWPVMLVPALFVIIAVGLYRLKPDYA